VSRGNTTTVVVAAPNPVLRGTPVTFTATITATAPSTGIPTGTVQFSVDGVNVGAPVAVDAAGKATYTTTFMAVGVHVVIAMYSGDAGYNASTSRPIMVSAN
jgi:hypothetical protein